MAIGREASELGFPIGFWPDDIKCPECKHNAHKTRAVGRVTNAPEIDAVQYQCEGCEEMIQVFND
jgi:hypothetical protein